MNDAEFEQQKQRLEKLAARWIEPLGLGWWDIEIGYCRSDFEVNGKPAPDAIGQCRADWRYGHAYIEFNMPLVAEQSDAKLERAFVHELMHIFLKEARETGRDWLDHEERVASSLTKAFLWLRERECHRSAGFDVSVVEGNGYITVTPTHNGTSSAECTSTAVPSARADLVTTT